jgi:hypothetical protein
MACYSLRFAHKRFRRPGMSKETKEMFIKKQVLYVIVSLLCWVAFFLNAAYRLYIHYYSFYTNNGELSTTQKVFSDRNLILWAETFQEASVYSALLTGLFMSVIRVLEPYIAYLIKKEFSSWFGEHVQEPKKGNDSLNSRLIAGVTVELVTIILSAITGNIEKENTYG